jgi:hypothetical protein
MPQAAVTQNPYGLRVRRFPCSVGGTGRLARNMVVESGTPDPTYCKPLGLYCTYEFVFGETQKPYLLHEFVNLGRKIPLPKLAVPGNTTAKIGCTMWLLLVSSQPAWTKSHPCCCCCCCCCWLIVAGVAEPNDRSTVRSLHSIGRIIARTAIRWSFQAI